jgi:hypothetical protein
MNTSQDRREWMPKADLWEIISPERTVDELFVIVIGKPPYSKKLKYISSSVC